MKHSLLTNPNDLHFAKVRTFAGNPLLITPDFLDQILIASDTKEIYLAVSVNEGGLLKLGGANNFPPPSSVATEWITFNQPITAQQGKSYLQTLSAEIFVTLPANPVPNQSINFFTPYNYLFLNTNGKSLSIPGEGNRPSPWDDYGIHRTRYVVPNKKAEITYFDESWFLVSGEILNRDYTP